LRSKNKQERVKLDNQTKQKKKNNFKEGQNRIQSGTSLEGKQKTRSRESPDCVTGVKTDLNHKKDSEIVKSRGSKLDKKKTRAP